ncbi:YceI family protein [Archangium primigenium]|uniref:YceI family protein n=1 Tax=[Archangium] primigenium TaxID=2792470 RepID=UPI00195E3D26|nr:YceI family protein [Archangium primigenium]MBM7114015.1 polyisoprenoid-binding protein [Archangium primigenium]
MKLFLKSVVAAAVLVPSFAFAATYTLDPSHSTAEFSVRHMMVSNVKGAIKLTSGSLNLDEKDVTKSTVEATLDTSTINTNEPKRDEHLKSADFFDAAKYPTITFKSTKVAKAGKDKLKVTGDFTLHGVTKPVVLDVTGPTAEAKDPWGNTVRGVEATTTINRKDFGLSWNKALETGGVAVSEDVKITLNLEMKKEAPAAAAPAAAEPAKK